MVLEGSPSWTMMRWQGSKKGLHISKKSRFRIVGITMSTSSFRTGVVGDTAAAPDIFLTQIGDTHIQRDGAYKNDGACDEFEIAIFLQDLNLFIIIYLLNYTFSHIRLGYVSIQSFISFYFHKFLLFGHKSSIGSYLASFAESLNLTKKLFVKNNMQF